MLTDNNYTIQGDEDPSKFTLNPKSVEDLDRYSKVNEENRQTQLRKFSIEEEKKNNQLESEPHDSHN
jgi:hypothetical protein